MQALEDMIHHFRARHVKVVLCEANERVAKKLADFGLPARLGQDDVSIELIAALDQAT